MPHLTATLISYNEEADLPRALASLAGIADEIILVDSGSTDRTIEIAQSLGIRVYSRKLDSFAEQKNYAASLASHDWILSMDCDEELSPELRASVLAWKEQSPEKNGYEILRLTNYLGGWIRHSGWYPEPRLVLYRRGKGKFVGAIHERVHPEGSLGNMNGHMFHYTIRSLAEHRAKLDAMTTLAAEDMFARGYKFWRPAMIFAAPWTIFQRLVLQGGILDGRRGWLIAWFSAKYIYVKYRKLGQLLGGKQLSRRSWPSPGGV
jgi:glycosyltransferase involved in cell wall biosynthesis